MDDHLVVLGVREHRSDRGVPGVTGLDEGDGRLDGIGLEYLLHLFTPSRRVVQDDLSDFLNLIDGDEGIYQDRDTPDLQKLLGLAGTDAGADASIEQQ